MTHKNRKKLINFIFCSVGCFLLRAEGLTCSLDVLCGGLRISKLQFLIKKISVFSAVLFFSIFGHQNRGSGLDPEPDTDRYSALNAGSGIS